MAEVVVALPRPLRRFAGGLSELPAEANDALSALRTVARCYPDLARHLLDDRGGLRRSVRVYRDGSDLRTPDQLAAPLAPADRLEIVLALAGG